MRLYVLIPSFGGIATLHHLGIAWRDSADEARFSRRLSFAAHEEDRDFSSFLDPAWREEFTHALEACGPAGEMIATYVPPGAVGIGHHVREFPRLAEAIDLRPFMRLTSAAATQTFDEMMLRPNGEWMRAHADVDRATYRPPDVRDVAIQIADAGEVLLANDILPADVVQARTVLERLRRGMQ